jgi:hypothetical protein
LSRWSTALSLHLLDEHEARMQAYSALQNLRESDHAFGLMCH